MPKYDYRCPSCGHVAEIEHGFNDHPFIYCSAPVDGLQCQYFMKKVISPAGVVFKGGGFYKTDSRKG